MRNMRVLHPPFADKSLPAHPRHAGPGRHARRHVAFLVQGQGSAPLHGRLVLCSVHRRARDRGVRCAAARSADGEDLPLRMRHHDGARRRVEDRQGGGRCHRRRVRSWRRGPERHPGRPHRWRLAHHRGGHQRDQVRHGPGDGRHGLREPQGPHKACAGSHRRDDQRRRRLLLRGHRQRQHDARRARVLPQGLGRVDNHRRRAVGHRDLNTAVPARHGAALAGHRVRRRQGSHRAPGHHPTVPRRRDRPRPFHHPHHAARRGQRGL
eukprot:Amastigsp_a773_342.p2 type:complete len:266 gc:universal Amastigsp_a773_342:326-1123(+)